MTLCEKYRPKCFADIKGHEFMINRLKLFIENFPRKKTLVLHGPAGTGKTSMAHALANEMKAEIIELNASDLRNRGQINKIVGEASKQQSLFAKTKIILVDEIDGISKHDFGGLTALLYIMKETNFPIILTANDIWHKKFSELRRSSEVIPLEALHHNTIFKIISEITQKESLNLGNDLLTSIAIKSKGDVRAAINDLQSMHSDSSHLDVHERDTKDTIFNIMKKILKDLPNDETLGLFDQLNMNLDEILLWMEENAPKEYQGEELYKAIEAISKADVFRGRIYRQQHWRFLIYQNFFLSVGIAAAKKQAKIGFTKYQRPTRILKIWMINQKYKYKKSIAEKYAKFCHVSKKRALREFPIIKNIIKDDEIIKQLNLDMQEIEFLKD